MAQDSGNGKGDTKFWERESTWAGLSAIVTIWGTWLSSIALVPATLRAGGMPENQVNAFFWLVVAGGALTSIAATFGRIQQFYVRKAVGQAKETAKTAVDTASAALGTAGEAASQAAVAVKRTDPGSIILAVDPTGEER